MGRTKGPAGDSSVRVIEMEVAVKAPVERVWAALVKEMAQWWPREMYTSEATRAMVLEPKVGGRMFEDWGDGEGLLWATVTGLKRPNVLELTGVSSPQWGGPNTHYHSFHLEEKDGATVVRSSDAVHGRVDDATEKSLREGWDLLLGQSLRAHCEAH